MNCIKCGKEIDETVKFCPECGFNKTKFDKEYDEILKLREEEKEDKIRKTMIKKEDVVTETRRNTINWTVAILVFIVLLLPIIPKENCAQLLGYNIACTTQHISILQLILGR